MKLLACSELDPAILVERGVFGLAPDAAQARASNDDLHVRMYFPP